jgi:hypothetical protein
MRIRNPRHPGSRALTCERCGSLFVQCAAKGPVPKYCDACFRRNATENSARWFAANPERHAEIKRNYRATSWNTTKAWTQYRITEDQFAMMLDAQGDRCAICRVDDPGSPSWHVDHDHAFDARDPRGHRGLLCLKCNCMLGLAMDSESTLQRGIEYLASHRTGLLS